MGKRGGTGLNPREGVLGRATRRRQVPVAKDEDSAGGANDRAPSQAVVCEDGDGAACLICTESDGTKMVSGVAGPACEACFKVYRQAFSIVGSFEVFAAAWQGSPKLQADWKTAQAIQEDPTTASWFPNEVLGSGWWCRDPLMCLGNYAHPCGLTETNFGTGEGVYVGRGRLGVRFTRSAHPMATFPLAMQSGHCELRTIGVGKNAWYN